MTSRTTRYVYGFRLRTPLTSWDGDATFLHRNATITIQLPERSDSGKVDSFVSIEAANHTEGFVLAGVALNSCLDSTALVTKSSIIAYHHFLTLKDQSGSVDRLAFRSCALRDAQPVTFDSDLVSSAQSLMDVVESSKIHSLPLRWLRHGYRSTTYIEHFMFYWLALERLAGDSRIERQCPDCRRDMSYSGVPRAKLWDIIRTYAPEIDDDKFELLWTTRHMLFHGSQLPDPERVGRISSLTPLIAKAVESALVQELGVGTRLDPSAPFGDSTPTMATGWFHFQTSNPGDAIARDFPSEEAVAKLQPEEAGDPVLCDPPPPSW